MRGSVPFGLVSICWAAFAAGLPLNAATGAPANALVSLDSERLAKLVKELAVPGRVAGISRNQAGTELLLTIETNREFILAIVSEHRTEVKRIPRETAEVAQDGRPICSYEKGYFAFSGGARLPHVPGAFIKFSPDRSVFFISGATPTNRARVFRTADLPTPLVSLPEAFLPQGLFVSTNEIFVFGQKLDTGRERSRAHGLIFSQQGAVVSLKKEINLSRFGTVLDMDISTGRLLVGSKNDAFRTWGLYDPATGKYESLGLARRRAGLFLSDALFEYLQRLWR